MQTVLQDFDYYRLKKASLVSEGHSRGIVDRLAVLDETGTCVLPVRRLISGVTSPSLLMAPARWTDVSVCLQLWPAASTGALLPPCLGDVGARFLPSKWP